MSKPTFTNAEGLSMMAMALFADIVLPLIVWVTLGIGILVTWPLNVAITSVLALWMYLRGGGRGQKGYMKKFLRRRGLFAITELIPGIGDGLAPLNTINVVLFLRADK